MSQDKKVAWTRSQLKTLKEKELCFKCGKPDHRAPDCPNPPADAGPQIQILKRSPPEIEQCAKVGAGGGGGGGAVQEVSRGNLIMGSGFQFDMVPIVDALNAS